MSSYRIIKSLKPTEVYQIITRGTCDDYLEKVKLEMIGLRKEYLLNRWYNDVPKLDTLSLYLSDSGFELYTDKEEAKRLEILFKSWKIFYEVWSKWYGGKTYTVGFNYGDDAFMSLYLEWQRDQKLNDCLNAVD